MDCLTSLFQTSALNFHAKNPYNLQRKFEFRHESNSPGNSQAYGKEKTALKTATTVLKKALASDKDVHLGTPASDEHSD